MSYIKNRFFEEINKRPERFEDEEFFHQQTQTHKTQNDNGKDSKNHKNSIQKRVG